LDCGIASQREREKRSQISKRAQLRSQERESPMYSEALDGEFEMGPEYTRCRGTFGKE
jgi:hypothetical protein